MTQPADKPVHSGGEGRVERALDVVDEAMKHREIQRRSRSRELFGHSGASIPEFGPLTTREIVEVVERVLRPPQHSYPEGGEVEVVWMAHPMNGLWSDLTDAPTARATYAAEPGWEVAPFLRLTPEQAERIEGER